MALFSYRGITLAGDNVEGKIRAYNQDALELKLSEEGILLESSFRESSSLVTGFHAFFKKSEITRLTRQMSVLISSGISVVESLEALEDQIEDKKLLAVYQGVRNSIISGGSIAASFKNYPAYFNNVFTSLLESGEVSGTLDTALERVADYREKSEMINNKVKSALTYPAVVVLVAVGVIFLLIAYIIPIFSTMYANFGAELPALTNYVVKSSEFIKGQIQYILALLFLSLIVVSYSLRTKKAKIIVGKLVYRIPGLKVLFLNILSSRFSRTMGVLLSSGVKLIDAVDVASKTVGNSYATEKLSIVPLYLSEGKSLAYSLAETRLFPKTIIKMSSAGESTGNLGGIFVRSADFYEKQVDIAISTVNSLIEPLVIIILGLFIAFILVAMYLPLFELVGQIGIN